MDIWTFRNEGPTPARTRQGQVYIAVFSVKDFESAEQDIDAPMTVQGAGSTNDRGVFGQAELWSRQCPIECRNPLGIQPALDHDSWFNARVDLNDVLGQPPTEASDSVGLFHSTFEERQGWREFCRAERFEVVIEVDDTLCLIFL